MSNQHKLGRHEVLWLTIKAHAICLYPVVYGYWRKLWRWHLEDGA